MSSVWEKLSRIDVSGHVEKKNGMSYLSWAWAWGKLRDVCPDATFVKHENAQGYPCFVDHNGYAFVKVTVTAGGDSQTETFPVLSYNNKPVQNPNSFEVNTALQRCLTKAIGYLGLGFHIYAGEDVPSPSAGNAQDVNAPPAQTPQSPVGQSSHTNTAAEVSNSDDDFVNEITLAIKGCESVDDLREVYARSQKAISTSPHIELINERFTKWRDYLVSKR